MPSSENLLFAASIFRISTKPVTSKISIIFSFTFLTTMFPCLFITFCAERRTRSPAEDMYSSFSMSIVRLVTPLIFCFSSFSSSGAVVVSSLPSSPIVSSLPFAILLIVMFPSSCQFCSYFILYDLSFPISLYHTIYQASSARYILYSCAIRYSRKNASSRCSNIIFFFNSGCKFPLFRLIQTLPCNKLCKETILCDQLLIGSILNDMALIQYNDTVTLPYGG